MRKLNAVKEQNNSSEEEEIVHEYPQIERFETNYEE
jgi:hypothetical protein